MSTDSIQCIEARIRFPEWLERRCYSEFALALLTLLVYARSLTLGFVYDDHVLIDNPVVFHWKDIPLLFTEDVIANHAANFYRPLTVLWYQVLYRFFALNAFAWHFSGIALHVLCVLLVFHLAGKVLGSRHLAMFAAAVFAVHPAHVEAVSWVSDAADLLMTAALLISSLAFIRWLQSGNWTWWIVSWLMALVCCFVKETGVLVPALLLVLVAIAEKKVRQPEIVLTGLALVATSGGFLLLRSQVLHGFAHPLSKAGNFEMLLTVPSALWFYLSHLLFPGQLGPCYPLAFVSDWRRAEFLLPVLLLTVILAAFVHLFLRSSSRPLIAFCAVWTLAPLLAPLYLKLFPEFELVHDRYLYIPTIALGVALAAALKKLSALLSEPSTASFWAVATVVLLTAAGVKTMSYQRVWQSDLTLFQRAIELTPRNARALVNLGVAKLQKGEYAEGTTLLKRALEIQPDNAFALFDLGNAAWENNDAATAESYFEKALQLESRFKWWVLLAKARFTLGKLPQAEWAVRQALATDSAEPGAHVVLGGLRLAQGDPATAVREFKSELQLNPGDTTAQELLRAAQQQIGTQHN